MIDHERRPAKIKGGPARVCGDMVVNGAQVLVVKGLGLL